MSIRNPNMNPEAFARMQVAEPFDRDTTVLLIDPTLTEPYGLDFSMAVPGAPLKNLS